MDAQEISEIFTRTLIGDYDDDAPWEAVRTLQVMGSREVFDRAADWCRSESPLKRARAADVLGQLGRTVEHPSNSFPDDCFSIVSDLLAQEEDRLPMNSAICALGHIGNPLAVPTITEKCQHSDAKIRFSVAFALGQFANERIAADTLLALMRDVNEDVRDWATVGLGVLGDSDSEEIREALWQRTHDPNRDVREEALVGLGKRRDRRVLPDLVAELNQPEVSSRVIEAADAFLGDEEQTADRTPAEYVAALRMHFSV